MSVSGEFLMFTKKKTSQCDDVLSRMVAPDIDHHYMALMVLQLYFVTSTSRSICPQFEVMSNLKCSTQLFVSFLANIGISMFLFHSCIIKTSLEICLVVYEEKEK